jgi:hypothetical protein
MYSKLRNKEFGIVDLLISGWKIFQKNFFAILIITLLVDFPLTLLDIAVSATGAKTSGFFYLDILLALWTGIAVMFIVEKEIFENKIQAIAALRKASYRWKSASFTSFLFGILLLLRLLLIIPGIMFLVNTAFFTHAVGLRNQGWKAALDYSRNLVKGSFWRVCYTFLAIFLIVVSFPSFIFYYLIKIVSELAGQGANSEMFVNVICSLFDALALHLYEVTGTVFFLNMDYRNSLGD